jgi:antitoxin ChpS
MLAIPPALWGVLHLKAGARVGLAVRSGRLVVDPQRRPRYTLDQLLALCDSRAPCNKEDREWLDEGPAGRELL